MKQLFRYYVIPIDFFTRERRHKTEIAWEAMYLYPSSAEDFPTFFQIADDTPTVYKFPREWPEGAVFFDGSGGCIVIAENSYDWILSEQSIINELALRANKHNDLIDIKQDWLHYLLKSAKSAIGKDDFPEPTINYVFGFYLLESLDGLNPEEQKLIKVLAEPSIVGIDDTKPCAVSKVCNLAVKTKETFLTQIADCEISADAELYITWATLVSVVASPNLVDDTKDMLISLEVRLQLVWNRCYSMSNFSDDIFTNKLKISDISKFYWSFVTSLDDAKSVLTSTLSSRASAIFDGLLKTSKVAGEIERLRDKVDLLEKYLFQQREKASLKYQRTIESLLFITALSQVVPLFFQAPVFDNHLVGGIAIGMTFLLGLIAILRR